MMGRQSLDLTIDDDGKEIVVHPGDVIRIKLAENPTTGYEWDIDDAQETSLGFDTDKFLGEREGLGAGGARIFTFKAEAEGNHAIQLKYWRHWAGDESVIQQFRATVRVV